MVNLGFIVEGDSEKILLSSEQFRASVQELGLGVIQDGIINTIGKRHLFHPKGDFTTIKSKVDSWVSILENKGADRVIFLLDIEDDDACITNFKSKVYRRQVDIVIVAKKSLEAWYLSDTQTLRSYLRANIPAIEDPESISDPFEFLKSLRMQYLDRGINDKKLLAKEMIRLGFSLFKAANHPNCNSAKYFLQKLRSL